MKFDGLNKKPNILNQKKKIQKFIQTCTLINLFIFIYFFIFIFCNRIQCYNSIISFLWIVTWFSKKLKNTSIKPSQGKSFNIGFSIFE